MPAIQLWDRVRAFFRKANLYRTDNIYQDQTSLDKIVSDGGFIDVSKQSSLLEQTNLQINRLERYKDYDMMDEVGEVSLALDMYSDEACLVGETRIPLLDGTCPTIKELADKGIDHKFWVYSYDLIKDKYVPAEAHAARITGRNVKVIKVTLDDGTAIKCTPDHLFLTKAGQYVRAKDLKINDSLMPLYKKIRYRSKDHKWYNNKPYPTCSEYAFLFDGERFTTIHRWVMNEVLGLNPQVIHHKDFNGVNNTPNNLESMTNEEHKKLHQKLGIDNHSFNNIKLSEIREKLQNWQGSSLTREDIFKLCDIGERVLYRVLRENNLTWHEFKQDYHKCNCGIQLSGIRTVCDACKKQYNAQLHQSKKTDYHYMMRRILNKRRYYQQNEAVAYKTCENCGIQKTINNFRRNNCSYSPYCDDCRPLACSRRYLQKSFANHKVISVETYDELHDVYDIEVPQYHNFAVGSDQSWVIVHNSLTDPERKHVIIVRAKSARLKKIIEDLLYGTLLMDREARPMLRYLCKYGDYAAEIIPTSSRDGVASVRFLNVYNFTRVQTRVGDLVGYFFQDQTVTKPIFLSPWQVMHLRLTSYENIYSPYGRSLLDGGRKDFKRLRLMEDAALIYRVTRAPEKRIFSIPVGNIPADQVPQYIELIARQMKKHKFVDPATGQVNERWSPLIQEDDFWLPKRCLAAGAKIPLLNGEELTVLELVQKYGHMRDDFWVYSFKDGKVVAAKAKACISPKNQQMVKVTLDNGQFVECTVDHKFMQRDGTWVEAKDLLVGSSLMPLYRRRKQYYDKLEYEQILQPDVGWDWTHKVVLPQVPLNFVRHHKNYNRFDNTPENIKAVNFIDHRRLHQDHAREILERVRIEKPERIKLGVERGIIKWNNENPELRKQVATDGAKLAWEKGVYDHIRPQDHVSYIDLEEYKEVWRELLKVNGGSIRAAVEEWNNNPKLYSKWVANKFVINEKIKDQWGYSSIEEFCGFKIILNGQYRKLNSHIDLIMKMFSDHGPSKAAELWNSDTRLNKIWRATNRGISKIARKVGAQKQVGGSKAIMSDEQILVELTKHNSISQFLKSIENSISRNHVTNVLKRNGYANFEEYKNIPVNHKVVSVEFLEEPQDTYCLEVEDTHCFFVSAGVLVHNSDGTGPTIDTLPGAENLDKIADIEYFKKKMIAGFKIPFNRVGIGDQAEPSGKSLAATSPEFAKSVQWIQREAVVGLKKLVLVHLALRGCGIEEMRTFDLAMTSASAIDELYRIETWNTRADVIKNLQETKLFPDQWILERFAGEMTNDEIRQMQRAKDERDEREASSAPTAETYEREDSGLLQEYLELVEKMPPIGRKLIDEDNQTAVSWYVNSKELDGLKGADGNIVEESVDPAIAKDLKDTTERILTFGGDGEDEKTPISDSTTVLSEDLPSADDVLSEDLPSADENDQQQDPS